MNKIPLIFKRSSNGFCTDEINPLTQWINKEISTPVRKWDGTCMMFDGKEWFARRQYSSRSSIPSEFILVEYDEKTGKSFGWEPVENSSFIKLWKLAIAEKPYHCTLFGCDDDYEKGTYELMGPKINGNPENLAEHRLMPHKQSPTIGNLSILEPHELTYNMLYNQFMHMPFEGVIFYTKDGKKAKLRRKDFDYGERIYQS
jgi:hypothetical protein